MRCDLRCEFSQVRSLPLLHEATIEIVLPAGRGAVYELKTTFRAIWFGLWSL